MSLVEAKRIENSLNCKALENKETIKSHSNIMGMGLIVVLPSSPNLQ